MSDDIHQSILDAMSDSVWTRGVDIAMTCGVPVNKVVAWLWSMNSAGLVKGDNSGRWIRTGDGVAVEVGSLSKARFGRLNTEAMKRGMTVKKLATTILESCIDDDLFKAVLDD